MSGRSLGAFGVGAGVAFCALAMAGQRRESATAVAVLAKEAAERSLTEGTWSAERLGPGIVAAVLPWVVCGL